MTHATGPQWQQINIIFTGGRSAAEHHARTALGPVLAAAENNGLITSWYFIRKPAWRIRYLPAGTTSEATTLLHDTAATMCTAGQAQRWTRGIYEPETRAFGGPHAMTIAHRLFHADSLRILTHPAPDPGTAPVSPERRRELSLLLCTALMRSAGQDRFERGDIWAKVSDLRTMQTTTDPARWDTFKTALARLIAVDTSPGTALRTQALQQADPWLTSFENTGQALRTLTGQGLIHRGIRAVLAHHIIFHWNRIGLSLHTQANLARAATEAIFD